MPSLLSGIDFERSQAFYDRIMEALGLYKGDKAIAGERHAHYVAPTFQLSLRPARSLARARSLATFFDDPDGLRLEIVARTSYRQTLVDRWDEFDRFLNPLAALPPRP